MRVSYKSILNEVVFLLTSFLRSEGLLDRRLLTVEYFLKDF